MEWRPRRNHACQILCQSVKGFLGGSAPKMAISYTFLNDPYNSAALPCRLWLCKNQPLWHSELQISVTVKSSCVTCRVVNNTNLHPVSHCFQVSWFNGQIFAFNNVEPLMHLFRLNHYKNTKFCIVWWEMLDILNHSEMIHQCDTDRCLAIVGSNVDRCVLMKQKL